MAYQFEIGDVVKLRSDIKNLWPLTITRQYSGDEYQVTWVDGKGAINYNAFPGKSLIKVNPKS